MMASEQASHTYKEKHYMKLQNKQVPPLSENMETSILTAKEHVDLEMQN